MTVAVVGEAPAGLAVGYHLSRHSPRRQGFQALGRDHRGLEPTMSTATICNVHQRRIEARPEQVWDLLMTMSGPDDRLWPNAVPSK